MRCRFLYSDNPDDRHGFQLDGSSLRRAVRDAHNDARYGRKNDLPEFKIV